MRLHYSDMKKGALSGWKEHECSFLSVSPALGLWGGLNSLKKGYVGVCEKEQEKEIEGDRAVVCQSVCETQECNAGGVYGRMHVAHLRATSL